MSNLRTRAGVRPVEDDGVKDFKITTIDAEKFLSEKLEQVLTRNKEPAIDDISLSLITIKFGRKFKPFAVLLPKSVLKGKRGNNNELEIFNPSSKPGSARVKDTVYMFLASYMFTKDDSHVFFNREWKSSMGISDTNAEKMNFLRTPRVVTISNNREYVVVLLNPKLVFHDMLVNLDNPTEKFDIGDMYAERIDDKNWRYELKRIPGGSKKKKNKKDDVDIASELIKKLGNR